MSSIKGNRRIERTVTVTNHFGAVGTAILRTDGSVEIRWDSVASPEDGFHSYTASQMLIDGVKISE